MIDPLVQQETSLLSTHNDPFSSADKLHEMLRRHQPEFVFCIASTLTSDVVGISAAGAGPEDRRLTPSIDADILVNGQPRFPETMPVSPIGIVSPVVISHACVNLLQARVRVVDCGTFRPPLHYELQAGKIVANCVSAGEALPYDHVRELFLRGSEFAEQLNPDNLLLIGECVPGGTTTALAVLMGSGISAQRLVSGSVMGDTRELKVYLAEQGLRRAGFDSLNPSPCPLRLISAVGDPMQAFAAGLAVAASQRMPVILAGGSQMLAVYRLCGLFGKTHHLSLHRENLFVVTTTWLAKDKFSNTEQLAKLVSAPFFSAIADFHASRFDGLRAYEHGHVKEGIGAGALIAAARARLSLSNAELVAAVDASYEKLVKTESPSPVKAISPTLA